MEKFKELPDLPKEISKAAWKEAKSTFRFSKESGLAKLLDKAKNNHHTLKSRSVFQSIYGFYTDLYNVWDDIDDIDETHIYRIEHNIKEHKDWEKWVINDFVEDCLQKIVETCDTLLEKHGNNKLARKVQKKMLNYLGDLKKVCLALEKTLPSKKDFDDYSDHIEELEKEIINAKNFLKLAMSNMIKKFLSKQAKERVAAIKECRQTLQDPELSHEDAVPATSNASINMHHIFRSGGIQLRQYFENKQSKPEVLAVLSDNNIQKKAEALYTLSGQNKRGTNSGYLNDLCKDKLEEKDYVAVLETINKEYNIATDFLNDIVELMKDIQKEYDGLN